MFLCVVFVGGATHSQRNGVEPPEGSGGFLNDGVEAFVLFQRSAHLDRRSSVLTVTHSDPEVNVMLKHAEISCRCCLGKVDLLMAGGAVEVFPVSSICPCHSKETAPLHC